LVDHCLIVGIKKDIKPINMKFGNDLEIDNIRDMKEFKRCKIKHNKRSR
jgi:hypothetical protein